MRSSIVDSYKGEATTLRRFLDPQRVNQGIYLRTKREELEKESREKWKWLNPTEQEKESSEVTTPSAVLLPKIVQKIVVHVYH